MIQTIILSSNSVRRLSLFDTLSTEKSYNSKQENHIIDDKSEPILDHFK